MDLAFEFSILFYLLSHMDDCYQVAGADQLTGVQQIMVIS